MFLFCYQRKVIDTKISGNLDGPEGGFDAIMQAVSCNVSVLRQYAKWRGENWLKTIEIEIWSVEIYIGPLNFT